MNRKPTQPEPSSEAVTSHPLPSSGGCYTVEAGALVQTALIEAAVETPLNPAETEA
jgi:hypothetical protein